MHLDFGPDVSGGASNLVKALAGVCEDAGGEVRTDAEVGRITVDGGRATGVELVSGEQVTAREAVVANVTPTVVFEDLVDDRDVPAGVADQVDDYTYGPGTMMVHLALSDLPDWEAGPEIDEFAYVHVGPYVDDMAETYTNAMNGQLPASPLLVVGQTTAVDPSRTPDDQHILWVQVRALASTPSQGIWPHRNPLPMRRASTGSETVRLARSRRWRQDYEQNGWIDR